MILPVFYCRKYQDATNADYDTCQPLSLAKLSYEQLSAAAVCHPRIGVGVPLSSTSLIAAERPARRRLWTGAY
jgi:hypothetical protein